MIDPNCPECKKWTAGCGQHSVIPPNADDPGVDWNKEWVMALAQAFSAEGYARAPLVPDIEVIRACLASKMS